MRYAGRRSRHVRLLVERCRLELERLGSADADAGLTLVKEGKLTVATSPDFPPFENLEGDEYVGFDIELARAIAQELGVECEFTTIQFDGIVPLFRPAARSTWASPASPSIRARRVGRLL